MPVRHNGLEKNPQRVSKNNVNIVSYVVSVINTYNNTVLEMITVQNLKLVSMKVFCFVLTPWNNYKIISGNLAT